MTSHSEHGAAIRGLSETLGGDQGPIDASMTRDALISTSRHLHDECGQVALRLVQPLGQYWTQASPSTTDFRILDDWPVAEFPLRRRGDTSESFRIIFRAKVSISTAGTATFRFALHPHGGTILGAFPPPALASTPNVVELTTTSTTGAHVESELYLVPSLMDAAAHPVSSLRGDGSLGSATVFSGLLTVWAKSSAGAPRLHGLEAWEFIGP